MLTIQRILEEVKSKNLPATLLFIDFSHAFDSINREKMKDILIIYGIPTEIINVILLLYKNTRSMVNSPAGDTPFFDITLEYYTKIKLHYLYALYVSTIY